MVGSERDLPAGDEISRAEYGGLRQPPLHSNHSSVLPRHALPSQIRYFHSVCRADLYHEQLRLLPPAGNQASPDRGSLSSMAKSLVLEEDCCRIDIKLNF